MSDEKPLKSAFELAMEKLRDRDRREGGEGVGELSARQKRRIAELRRAAQAKLAELEILHRGRRAAVQGQPEELAKVEEHYAIDRRRVESKLESDIARIKRGDDAGDD